MYKCFIFGIICLLGYGHGICQNTQPEVMLGAPYKVVDASRKYYFSKDGEILSIKVAGEKMFLQKHSVSGLREVIREEYTDFPAKYVLEKVIEFNDRYFVFYSLWDKPNQTEQLFVREIDFDQTRFVGEARALIKIVGKVAGSFALKGYWRGEVTDKFDFYTSHNDSKLLIQYRVKPEVKNDAQSYDVIGFNVYDSNLQHIWSKEVQMPYTEKAMNNLSYSVNSEGEAYVLSMVYEDNTTDLKKSKHGPPNYHIELLKIKPNSSVVETTRVYLKDDKKFINYIRFFENNSEWMTCAGYYNLGKDSDAASGIFLFKIDKEGKILEENTYAIPLEILNQYVSAKAVKKNEKQEEKKGGAEFKDLELVDLIYYEDGSLILLGEQYYMKSHTTYVNNRTYTYYTYHYNDILATKIDKDGKLAWMHKLPKRQTGKSWLGGMSYEYMYSEAGHYLLFMDNLNNLELDMQSVPATHMDGAGGFLTAYKIDDETGRVDKISIFNSRNVNGMPIFQFLTRRIIPTDENEFVVEVYKKKKEDILIKVKLP